MGKIIRSNIDFLYVKGNSLFAHKLPIFLPPKGILQYTGTYYLTYNVTFRQLVSSFWVVINNHTVGGHIIGPYSSVQLYIINTYY